jgi:hypothetical protein
MKFFGSQRTLSASHGPMSRRRLVGREAWRWGKVEWNPHCGLGETGRFQQGNDGDKRNRQRARGFSFRAWKNV